MTAILAFVFSEDSESLWLWKMAEIGYRVFRQGVNVHAKLSPLSRPSPLSTQVQTPREIVPLPTRIQHAEGNHVRRASLPAQTPVLWWLGIMTAELLLLLQVHPLQMLKPVVTLVDWTLSFPSMFRGCPTFVTWLCLKISRVIAIALHSVHFAPNFVP